ncbi:hypothetical protein MPSEU_000748200 [Mayamaea pseudoterrestris]|nr:hypothetical protein MPSEU_000748200 [Mayamaea pseudoterrestris]
MNVTRIVRLQKEMIDYLHHVSLMLLTVAAMSTTVVSAKEESISEADQMRLDAKPWFAKNLEIQGFTLPISPVTLLILWISVTFLCSCLPRSSRSHRPKASHAVASHILSPDEQELHKLKAEIGDNSEMFAEMAAKVSTCSSSKDGGNLGKFHPGQMAPPFERAVFDPDAIVVGTTIGPIQTHFGWHLIHVHERTMAE